SFSTSATSLGWPQLRLRERRIACQAAPSMGSAAAPAKQPLAYKPIARAANGAGVLAAPNNCLASGPRLMAFFLTGFLTAATLVGTPPGASTATRVPAATRPAPKPPH